MNNLVVTNTDLTPEQIEAFLQGRVLTMRITTKSGYMMSAESFSKSISEISKLLRSVAKNVVPERANKLCVSLAEVELLPHQGGILAEVTFLLHEAIEVKSIKWQTDEQMQQQIEGWKKRREADNEKTIA